MTFSVNYVEALWVGINLVTLALTITALFDARADREAVRLLNGKARELAATGIVRRELFRAVVQACLLLVAVPGLFSDREATLSPVVLLLMAVPVLLLAQSFLDSRDRKQMTVLVTADALLVKTEEFDTLRAMLAENTEISQGARDDAKEAAAVANHINDKLAAQGDALLLQGEERAERLAHTEQVVDTTAEQVSDLHEGSAPAKEPS